MRITSKNKRLYRIITLVLIAILIIPVMFSDLAYATEITVLEGQVKLSDTANTIKNDSGTVTATAKGSLFSKAANTITITNNTQDTAQLSFDYSVSSANSFTVDGASKATSGSINKTLAAGGTVVIYIQSKSGLSGTTVTLTISNISLTVAAASSDVTINFDSALGSVTAGGEKVTSGSTLNVSLADGVVLVATPASGVTFLGWVNEGSGAVLSTATNYTLYPAQDVTVIPAFASSSTAGWFSAGGGSYLFSDLNDAATYASSANNKTIVLAADGTLPAGNYTIPSGVTLLIPRDAAHTVDKTTPATTKPTNFGTTPPAPTSFRKLTMANGANISVSGAISIAGTQWAGGLYVSVTGAAGFVHMNSGSTITVNNGGSLYAWGYITGSGSVTAKSGATIYEHFQVAGWRGGDMTSTMINSNTYGVFPMSQYYVQNIEVPLRLESGVVENTYASASISVIGIQPISVAFVGTDNAMFKITSGYVIKDYIEGEDRLKIEIYGDVSLTPIEINMKLGILGSVSLKTAEFVLPINNNMTIHAVSGNMAIDQDAALLPGTQVIIDAEAKCTIGNGVSLYAYSSAEWGTYCGSVNKTFIAVAHAPGRTYTRTAADLVDASVCVNGTVDASQGYIYTTESGANIFSSGNGVIKLNAGTQEYTYQVVQAGEPADSAYPAIPITSAKLKNGDGTYVQTVAGTYTYCGECLQWLTSHGNATNVELGNSLNMYFAFWSSSITEKSKQNYYVIVTHTDAAGNKTTQTFTHDLWLTTTIKISDTEEQFAYVVPYRGLAAKQMGDTVQVTLYKSGTAMHTWTDSIQDYAMRMLEKYEADENKGTLRTLLVDMLNYGAACQKKFGYDTDNLVNAGLSDEQKIVDPATINWSEKRPNGSDDHKANLIVDGNIRFVISNVDGHLPYTFMNHWDKDRGGDLLYDETGKYYYVSKLYVADARQTITIIVNETTTVEDSVEAYCYRMIHNTDATETQKAVCTTFMKFSNSAYNYLHDDEVNRV